MSLCDRFSGYRSVKIALAEPFSREIRASIKIISDGDTSEEKLQLTSTLLVSLVSIVYGNVCEPTLILLIA